MCYDSTETFKCIFSFDPHYTCVVNIFGFIIIEYLPVCHDDLFDINSFIQVREYVSTGRVLAYCLRSVPDTA